MDLPIVEADLLTFLAFPAGGLLIGLFFGWLWGRRRRRKARFSAAGPLSDQKLLLRLLSRYDHALGNYLSSIVGNLNNVSRDGDQLPQDPERWRVSRQAILESAGDMRRTIERLKLVRLGLDPEARRVDVIDLRQMLESVLLELSDNAERRDIKPRMEVKGLSQPVLGDSQMLAEVFTTIIDNAIKHSGATELVVEAFAKDSNAVVRISDNGKGMSSELLKTVFEEGVRDRRAGSTPGTGMGLAIAKVLLEANQSSLSVESHPGRGTLFTVTLPLKQPRT